MKPKLLSKLLSAILYMIFAIGGCSLIYFYVFVLRDNDIVSNVGGGILKILFPVVGLACLAIPIIFGKKLKLRKSALLVLFTVLSILINFALYTVSESYISHFSKDKWDKYVDMRHYMIDSFNQDVKITGKDETFVIDMLGEPDKTEDGKYIYNLGFDKDYFYDYEVVFNEGFVEVVRVIKSGPAYRL